MELVRSGDVRPTLSNSATSHGLRVGTTRHESVGRRNDLGERERKRIPEGSQQRLNATDC